MRKIVATHTSTSRDFDNGQMLRSPLPRRRASVAVAAVPAPLALLVGTVLHPPHGALGPPSWVADTWLGAAERAPGRFYVSHVLFLAGFALVVPAVLRIADAVAGATPGLAAAGRSLALVGAVGAGSLSGADLVVWRMGQSSDSAQMVALMHDLTGSPGFMAPIVVLTAGLAAGAGLLAIALRRAGIAPVPAGLLIVGGIAVWVGGFSIAWLALIGAMMIFAGFAWVAWCIWLHAEPSIG